MQDRLSPTVYAAPELKAGEGPGTLWRRSNENASFRPPGCLQGITGQREHDNAYACPGQLMGRRLRLAPQRSSERWTRNKSTRAVALDPGASTPWLAERRAGISGKRIYARATADDETRQAENDE